jgi:hypothetical protein
MIIVEKVRVLQKKRKENSEKKIKKHQQLLRASFEQIIYLQLEKY